MTPLGHLSVSYISGSYLSNKFNNNVSLPAVIVGGLLPDTDFIFILFDWFNEVHRVVSHNLLFILISAFIFSLFAVNGRKYAVAMGLFIGGGLHLGIDSVLDNNPTNGVGIALFWPFYSEFVSPFNLLHLNDQNIGWDQPLKMIMIMCPLIIYEIPLYFVAIIFFIKRKAISSMGASN